MSPFEFIFALFGLLLGLSLTEVLGGFGKALKSRTDVKIGWLTPLLGVLVALELTAAWASAWTARQAIPFSVLSLFVALLITGVYYLAATQVFPDKLGDWPDLDTYFERHKRWVAGALGAGWAILMVAQAVLGVNPFPDVYTAAMVAVWYLLLAGLAFASSRRANLLALVALIALDLGQAGVNAVADPFKDNAAPAAEAAQ